MQGGRLITHLGGEMEPNSAGDSQVSQAVSAFYKQSGYLPYLWRDEALGVKWKKPLSLPHHLCSTDTDR